MGSRVLPWWGAAPYKSQAEPGHKASRVPGKLQPHTQRGREPGQEVTSLAHPSPAGQIWLCCPRPPCVWGAQLGCLEEPSTSCNLLTSFPSPPGTGRASPGLTADSPQQGLPPRNPTQPCLHHRLTPDLITAEFSTAWEEILSSILPRVTDTLLSEGDGR